MIENGLRVLIAACDTFRAGAVEQLRTHTRKLNALHSPEMHGGVQMVQLYEKGYGKDAASIAMEAINFGKSLPHLFSPFLFGRSDSKEIPPYHHYSPPVWLFSLLVIP